MHRPSSPVVFRFFLWCVVLQFIFISSHAQEDLSAAELKQLSVEELMNIKVTLVSRSPQQLTDAASAIQVITGEDIRRSGARIEIASGPGATLWGALVVARYMDDLKKSLATPAVPRYMTFDAWLAWVTRNWELAVAGQNLAKKRHAEFGAFNIPRSVYAKIAARF